MIITLVVYQFIYEILGSSVRTGLPFAVNVVSRKKGA